MDVDARLGIVFGQVAHGNVVDEDFLTVRQLADDTERSSGAGVVVELDVPGAERSIVEGDPPHLIRVGQGRQGAERARRASEAFLFRRLQGLPETRDGFRVNERLPIPFSEDGRMEVDLLDPESKLVIELDGSQHLADREAYRRDRRKDALLQEHGYLVLRFLAEDLGTRLDAVLDEVLRALARRMPSS